MGSRSAWQALLRGDCWQGLGLSLLWLAGPLIAFALLQIIAAPVLPRLDVLATSTLSAPLAAAALWVPLAAGVTGVMVGGRWTEDGSRLALVLAGRRRVHLVRALTPVALAVLTLGLLAALVVEPSVQRWTLRQWTAARPALHLWPGTQVHIDGLTISVDGVDAGRVWLEGRDWVATSPQARLQPASLELGALDLVSLPDGGVRVHAKRAQLPLVPPSVRVPLAARGTVELVEVAQRTEAAGRDARYEWAILYKRLWCGPVSAVWLLLGWVLASSPRRWRLWGGCVVGWLLAVRLGDGLVFSIGSLLGSLVAPALLCCLLFVAARWARLP